MLRALATARGIHGLLLLSSHSSVHLPLVKPQSRAAENKMSCGDTLSWHVSCPGYSPQRLRRHMDYWQHGPPGEWPP